jgi:D-glycero-D-manno-heptose 1,7-bisphosphate phosphatase
MRKALFLDRDGVINYDTGYCHVWSDSLIIEGLKELALHYQNLDYKLIIITNQSGIGRGYYTEAEFRKFMNAMEAYLSIFGINMDGYYFCPCLPTKRCSFRKPEPGMILRAADEHEIDLSKSMFVGDKETDMLAADKAGIIEKYLFSDDLCVQPVNLKNVKYKHITSLTQAIK